MDTSKATARVSAWWHKGRILSHHEKLADGIVHVVGLALSLLAGSALLTAALIKTAPQEFPALLVYVTSLVVLFAVSMAFNLWPRTPFKRLLARLDQAAIFLFIAGTYTPFLAMVWERPEGVGLTVFVWGAALLGIGLKLIVPEKFGRLAIGLYLAIGWSGVVVFRDLAAAVPPSSMWFLVAGGLTYSFGIIFHLWEKLKFYTALWHLFVVAGATLHLIAIFNAMVLSRI